MNEKLVFKLFLLVVHMSPLWWGLHLVTFWCPWYPWIFCKGPTWPWKKWNLFYFFHIFYFNSKGSYQIASIFDMLIIIVSPVRSTYGGYYGLVVVTPRPRPQTLHRSHDNLKKSLSDCFHILYVDWYRWEDAWGSKIGPVGLFMGHPGPPE